MKGWTSTSPNDARLARTSAGIAAPSPLAIESTPAILRPDGEA